MVAPPHRVVPAPVTVASTSGSGYEVTGQTVIHAPPRATEVGEYLAGILRPSTGLPLPVVTGGGVTGIQLLLAGAPAEAGDEGYQLVVDEDAVTVRAHHPAGLRHGVQTLRQLLPPAVESRSPQPGPWRLPAVRVVDRPRYPYRGAMLDVARHFFAVETIERYLDRLALYKINHLHLHLTDDQGWRLAIESWPNLARHGGLTQVGGGPGGSYSRKDYQRIVAYAAARHITVVPEIDMPGHINAALSSYPELTRDGVAPPLYTGMKVGFSTLYADLEVTYRFVADVLGEVAALTPGPTVPSTAPSRAPYLHIGGDEAFATTAPEYAAFLARVQPIVAALGRTVMGWQEVAAVDHAGPRVLQQWRPEPAGRQLAAAAAGGAMVVLSPANRAYLDMKYDLDTPVGLDWAGPVEVRDAYDWDPGSYLDGVPDGSVLGVEAALFSETISTPEQIDFLTFPRLPALAEVGWSPAAARDWAGFRQRLAAHAPRWQAAGITFHPSPQIPWD